MEIIAVDSSLIVINKPAGLPVLPDGWQPEAPYVVRLLEAEFGRIWIVHRLDKVTSGVLVCARTAEAHRSLSMQFERHEIAKRYHALANGVPEWNERTCNLRLRTDIGHHHRTRIDARHGKDASTIFHVLGRFKGHSLLEAQPVTGRTHQVRAHAAGLHHPLLGDSLYGAPATKLIARPALHAASLRFVHPDSGESTTCEAPYPEDFAQALGALRRRQG
jgi:RluA family pseudouridine synthase